MSLVKLITSTPDAEKSMAYIARVSNPKNQGNDDFKKLLGYCIKNEHWSVFEQAYMTLQIETTRGIAAQILRHRSFTFQEFSQRYADSMQLGDIPIPELRRQDNKNRQNSISDLSAELIDQFSQKIKNQFDQNKQLYEEMLEAGIAKECARFVLPLATPTRIYMTGSCRSWIHYITLRTGNGTQKEHMNIAKECKNIFSKEYPIVSSALNWIV
tara:strand:- start:1543 stop:2181 length:639 start_codon:yes stop_codon:yes gene_type:complete